jgi:hypothetical protein
MKLTYRGVSYNYNPPQTNVVKGEVLGTYRGSVWHAHPLIAPMPLPAAHNLKYRGVAYNTCSDLVTTPVGAPAQTMVAIASRGKSFLSAVTTAHHDAILRNVERRLQSAKAKGDDRLVHLLEDELRQVA